MAEFFEALGTTKGEAATAEYRNEKNRVSIDGLPTGWGEA